MHPARILAELKVKESSVKEIARTCRVSESAVYNTIYQRPFVSPKVQREIAQVTGISVSEIWPEEETELVA